MERLASNSNATPAEAVVLLPQAGQAITIIGGHIHRSLTAGEGRASLEMTVVAMSVLIVVPFVPSPYPS
jgi:hypothetical protein